MDEAQRPGSPDVRPPAGYEASDLKPRSIAVFGLALAVTIGLVLVLAHSVVKYFSARQAAMDARPSPLAGTMQPPPEPRLQVNPGKDLREMRAAEDSVLQSYGWVDPEAGIVRIPIDRAIELVAERRLPVRKEGEGERMKERDEG